MAHRSGSIGGVITLLGMLVTIFGGAYLLLKPSHRELTIPPPPSMDPDGDGVINPETIGVGPNPVIALSRSAGIIPAEELAQAPESALGGFRLSPSGTHDCNAASTSCPIWVDTDPDNGQETWFAEITDPMDCAYSCYPVGDPPDDDEVSMEFGLSVSDGEFSYRRLRAADDEPTTSQ